MKPSFILAGMENSLAKQAEVAVSAQCYTLDGTRIGLDTGPEKGVAYAYSINLGRGHFAEWNQFCEDEKMTVALLDRLTHKAQIL